MHPRALMPARPHWQYTHASWQPAPGDITCIMRTHALVAAHPRRQHMAHASYTLVPSWQLTPGHATRVGHYRALEAACPFAMSHALCTLVPSWRPAHGVSRAAGTHVPSWQLALGDSTCTMHTRALVAARPRQYHRHHAPSCPHGSSLAGCHMCCAHAYPCDGSPSAIARASCTLVPSWQLACGRALVVALSRRYRMRHAHLCPYDSSPSPMAHAPGKLVPSWLLTRRDITYIMHTRAFRAARPRQYHMHRAHSCPRGSSPSATAHALCTVLPLWWLIIDAVSHHFISSCTPMPLWQLALGGGRTLSTLVHSQ